MFSVWIYGYKDRLQNVYRKASVEGIPGNPVDKEAGL